jgi:hypothetical protein
VKVAVNLSVTMHLAIGACISDCACVTLFAIKPLFALATAISITPSMPGARFVTVAFCPAIFAEPAQRTQAAVVTLESETAITLSIFVTITSAITGNGSIAETLAFLSIISCLTLTVEIFEIQGDFSTCFAIETLMAAEGSHRTL